MPCWLCSSSRPSSPACEPDVRIEPPCELAPRIRCARRAASRIPVSGRALRAALADPGERTRLARRAASRSRLASCPPTFDGGKISPWCAPRRPAPWQRTPAMCSRQFGDGGMLAKCVPRRLAVASFRRGAFPGGHSWQFSRFMHPRRGPGREKRPSLATYRRHASKTSWLWQDMRAMYPKSPANRLSGMHSAQILPGRGPFRCTGPSNHAWRANLARAPTARTPRIMHGARISPGAPQIMHRTQILPSSGDLCLSVARCPPLKDGEFRFHCFGGARSSVLVRRTIPPCRLGYGILELLGLRHPCLVGKSPVPSLSSAGYPAAAFSAGWRASASPASAA